MVEVVSSQGVLFGTLYYTAARKSIYLDCPKKIVIFKHQELHNPHQDHLKFQFVTEKYFSDWPQSNFFRGFLSIGPTQ